jgi:hypothetical protein
MNAGEKQHALPVPIVSVCPYVSLTLLEITLQDPHLGFLKIATDLEKKSVEARQGVRHLAASGIPDDFFYGDSLQWMVDDIHDAHAFIVCCDNAPQWIDANSGYLNTDYHLVVIFRRNNLLSIHTDLPSLRDGIQSWLNRSPAPPFRRIAEGFMNAAFVKGDTKGLWLRGTHARRTTKADTKTISGRRLDDALLPHEDSSFAMGSVRVMLPDDLGLVALSGPIGITPRKSQLWASFSSGIADFFAKANDALVLVEAALAAGLSVDQPFPLLARREADLSAVSGAFDFSLADPSDITPNASSNPELLESAALLARATIAVEGKTRSSNFTLHVGLDGAIGGALTGRIEEKGENVRLRFGFNGNPTNGPPVRAVLDALTAHGDDLLTIYYESGHTVVEKAVWKRELKVSPFPNWDFWDLTTFDIEHEKPAISGDQAIHDAIGAMYRPTKSPGLLVDDRSLFAWVVQHYNDGWLICDDGSGEVADFVHISPEAKLSLIHVKGAKGSGTSRQIAVGPYEVVASQAVKNWRYISPRNLAEQLRNCTLARPACWTEGKRAADRSDFLQVLDWRRSDDPIEVVIVQPHVSELRYESAMNDRKRGLEGRPDVLRITLLEALLNSARSSIVGAGADLRVSASKI